MMARSHLSARLVWKALSWVLYMAPCLLPCLFQACRADDATAPTVRVQISQSSQPFAMRPDSGLNVDIIRAAFASQSVRTKFVFLPNLRSGAEYEEGRVDVLTNAKPGSNLNIVLSHWPVFRFRNQAITLKKKEIKLQSIAELGNFRVTAFQGASQFLGGQYAAMAAHNKKYTEISSMASFMLHFDSTDVMVTQPDIFRFNLIQDGKRMGFEPHVEEFDYHDILGDGNNYWFGFRTQALRDQFEQGIAAIYRNGEIEKIFASYATKFATSRDMFIHLDCRFLSDHAKLPCPKLAAPEQ